MEKLINTQAPEGWSTVSPYLMVDNVEKEMDFLIKVFGAKFREPLTTPDGSILHVAGMIYEVGIMIGRHRAGFPPVTSMNYVFAENVDETYERALSYGAKSIMKPVDQFYDLFRKPGLSRRLSRQTRGSRPGLTLSDPKTQALDQKGLGNSRRPQLFQAGGRIQKVRLIHRFFHGILRSAGMFHTAKMVTA